MKIMPFCLLIVLTVSSFNVASQDKGQIAFQRGHFELAIQYWDETLSNLSPKENPERYIDTSIRLSIAYKSLGRLKEAFRILQYAQPFAEKNNDSTRYANFLSHLSDIYIAMSDLKDSKLCQMMLNHYQMTTPEEIIETALSLLKKAEAIARKQNDNALLFSNILNKKGNILSLQMNILNNQEGEFDAEEKYFKAVKTYQNSVKLANKAGDHLLSAKTSINIIQIAVQIGDDERLEKELKSKTIFQQVKELPNSHDKAFSLIRLAHLIRHLKKSHKHEVRTYAYHALTQALEVGKILNDNRAIAYAKGDLAKLYADEKHYPEAIQLTRQAIFYTQNALGLPLELQRELWGFPDLLFRWEWQLGNFLKANNQEQKAIHAYEKAATHLQQVRTTYGSVPHNFLYEEEKFYFDFADILLKQAATTTASKKQQLLKKAIDSIESLKHVELRNYLIDDCMERFPEKIDISDTLPSNTAIFYPLLFDNRIELLLSSNMGIQQFIISHIDVKQLITYQTLKIHEYMDTSLKFFSRETQSQFLLPILKILKKLHSFLIGPVISVLDNQKIDTGKMQINTNNFQ